MKIAFFVFLLLAGGFFYLFDWLIKSKKVNIKITKCGIIAVSLFAAGILVALYDLLFKFGTE